MNSWLGSALQGLLQGLTEYLPVSSSGHLSLYQIMTGFEGPALAFDLVLHLATLLATLLYFRRDILVLASRFFGGFVKAPLRESDEWRFGWAVVVGTVVTGLVGLPLKSFVEVVSQSSHWLALFWLVTAACCFAGSFLPSRGRRIGLRFGLIVGLVQGLAVIPGISRSGSTIVAALALGLSRDEAFRFSFLLSLPAIAGAALLELKDAAWSALPAGWWLGFLVAFAVGLGALVLLRRVVAKKQWWPFGVYCVLLAAVALFFA